MFWLNTVFAVLVALLPTPVWIQTYRWFKEDDKLLPETRAVYLVCFAGLTVAALILAYAVFYGSFN